MQQVTLFRELSNLKTQMKETYLLQKASLQRTAWRSLVAFQSPVRLKLLSLEPDGRCQSMVSGSKHLKAPGASVFSRMTVLPWVSSSGLSVVLPLSPLLSLSTASVARVTKTTTIKRSATKARIDVSGRDLAYQTQRAFIGTYLKSRHTRLASKKT